MNLVSIRSSSFVQSKDYNASCCTRSFACKPYRHAAYHGPTSLQLRKDQTKKHKPKHSSHAWQCANDTSNFRMFESLFLITTLRSPSLTPATHPPHFHTPHSPPAAAGPSLTFSCSLSRSIVISVSLPLSLLHYPSLSLSHTLSFSLVPARSLFFTLSHSLSLSLSFSLSRSVGLSFSLARARVLSPRVSLSLANSFPLSLSLSLSLSLLSLSHSLVHSLGLHLSLPPPCSPVLS